jgi:hypothetical protein
VVSFWAGVVWIVPARNMWLTWTPGGEWTLAVVKKNMIVWNCKLPIVYMQYLCHGEDNERGTF